VGEKCKINSFFDTLELENEHTKMVCGVTVGTVFKCSEDDGRLLQTFGMKSGREREMKIELRIIIIMFSL
jgi:hypothetical protein